VTGYPTSILLGNGVGGFGPRTDIHTDDGPHSVAIGDLNHDGKPDLVIANYVSGTASILLGNGSGTFAPVMQVSTGPSPYSVALADFNGDGNLDLVTSDYGANTASIMRGNGDGTFGPRAPFATGDRPASVAVADFNGDGKPDLALACEGMGGVSVLLNDGTGAFGPPSNVPTGGAAWAVVAGDLNGDGKPDLAVSNYGDGSVSILLGAGNGLFVAAPALAAGPGPRALAMGDLNGDGRPDLVVPNDGAGSVSVFLGDGSGGFPSKTDLAVGSNPYADAIGDFNRDGFPDIVSTNISAGTLSILIQVNPGSPTACALGSAPNPSTFGQGVTLSATVSPASATGQVAFLDGATTIGSATLAGGVASLVTSDLATGVHSLTASYGGDGSHAPSLSPAIQQTVTQAATMTALASNPNPAIYLETVTFTAAVSVVPPGAGHPGGGVQFRIDNVDVGSPAPLDASGHASLAIATLAAGDHSVQASFIGDLNYSGSSSPVLTQTVTPPSPVIVAVRDVPNDQGGHVFINWQSPLDHPGVRVVTGYRVWRRAPNPVASAARRASTGVTVTTRPDGAALDGYWEALATLPAEQLVNYAYDAPTTQDSIPGSNPLTAFFVTALTADPFVFFPSAPDSGYSVDNLAPPTPMPFAASYMLGSTALHWGANPAPDLHEYRLYRGLGPNFVPGPGNLVIATGDTGYVDVTPTPYVYKLDAIDIHGNPSRYAVVTPNGPVATLASLVSIDADARRISLGWYSAGNTGLAATIYRRTAATDWSALQQAMFDGTGFLRFDDTSVQPGTRYGYRLGIMDGGVETFVAEAWVTAEAPEVALEGARPNPAVAGAVKVAFTLSSAGRARLELIDVGGRLVAARDVGALGPGPHTVDLEEGGRVPPGVYLIRLTAASHSFTRRVAVLP